MDCKTEEPNNECIQPEESNEELNLPPNDIINADKFLNLRKKEMISNEENNSRSALKEFVNSENVCVRLKNLNICCNLFKVPDLAFKFKHLTDLDLSFNALEHLPDEIKHLQNLVSLNLSGNKLEFLSNFLKYNHRLMYLNISHNNFITVPNVLYCGLRMIEILDMSFNKITNFSEPPKCLSNLLELRLTKNELEKLPEWIFNSPCQLQILELGSNEININYEPVINYYNSRVFQTLQVLNIENCNYRSDSIQFLHHFKNIQILHLGNGTVLDQGNDMINYLPVLKMDVFKNFTNLKKLNLKNVGLCAVPSDFDTFTNLEFVDLSENLLSWLPENFCLIKSLKIIDLTSNQLLFLPQSIGDLVNLQEIHLGNNKLDELPQSFSDLNNLEFIDLYDNKIETIDPNIILQKKLRGIDLGKNCLDFSKIENNDNDNDNINNSSDINYKHYDRLKISFREQFGFVKNRSDVQSTVSNRADEIYCDSSSENNSLSDEDSISNLEELSENAVNADDDVSKDEWWDRCVSPETEKDDFFDPNDISYPLKSPTVGIYSEFQRNFCPGFSNARSLRLTGRGIYNEIAIEDNLYLEELYHKMLEVLNCSTISERFLIMEVDPVGFSKRRLT